MRYCYLCHQKGYNFNIERRGIPLRGVVAFWVSDVENPTESQKNKVTLTVKQEGVQAASLTVTPTKLDYDGEGGTQTVTITTNQPKITYSISDEDKSWITVSGTKSAIDFKVEPNPSTEPRTAKVEIRARNENNDIVARETVTINQKGGTKQHRGDSIWSG